MKKEINAVISSYNRYEAAAKKLEVKIKEACDFDAYLAFCSGERHVVGNYDTANVAPLHCLYGKNKHNKLTAEEHEEYCI